MTGPKAQQNRYVSIHFKLDGDDYIFRRIEGDRVICWRWEGEEFGPDCDLSIYDVWRSTPLAVQFWQGYEFRFTSWTSFAREQTWRGRALFVKYRELLWWMQGAAVRFRKKVAVERFTVLNAVRNLEAEESAPGEGTVTVRLLGPDWLRHDSGRSQHMRIIAMLEALVDLQELKKVNYRYKVTGKGVAALSQYEEEERKHKEAMGLQRGIRWLTVAMAIAALLQAKVVEFPPLLKWTSAWPWQ
ncbi:hypothetical protein LQE85_08695 [Stenotrophomonas rhizophila]|uniref:hypothetical protein n=1 Tax=Stenotrophomonas rhizophila TaxID=216778 RepID=UPI00201D20E7|nr:hypothetical protein [Stenotrophomonas rhizophila]UQY89259.1 hypothetical protein LQE85_08695 [Stenotrophomonas rhizophila]